MTSSWRVGTPSGSPPNSAEVARLQGVQHEWHSVVTQILTLADELGRGTIERQLDKSDLQLGLEHLLGAQRPL